MKKIVIITLFLLPLALMAQDSKSKKSKSFKDRYIKGFCVNFFTEGGTLRNYERYTLDYQNNRTYIGHKNGIDNIAPVAGSLFFIGFNNHFILKEFTNEKSISLNIFPSLGCTFSETRFGSITIPVFLNYSVGNVSTYSSKKDHGITVGLGFEYSNSGLLNYTDQYTLEDLKKEGFNSKSYQRILPAMNFGYRYFNGNDKAKEVNITLGMTKQKNYDTYGMGTNIPNTTPFWVRLSRVHYINY